MKKVLLLGGAGQIGYNLIPRLIESSYIVTVLDLPGKENEKKLNIYKNKINIIFGDVEDQYLIKDLIQKHDIVINYAGIMPPYANYDQSIAESTNFIGSKNVVDAILEINPNCKYFYMSFVSVYGNTNKKIKKIVVESELDDFDDLYTISIIKSENYIREKLKNFVIIRMPIVLTKDNYYLRHMRLNSMMDFITKEDLNNYLVSILENKKALGKVYNISGFKANTNVFIDKMYKDTGVIKTTARNLYFGEVEDYKIIDEMVQIKKTSLSEYFNKVRENSSPIISKIKKIFNLIKYILFKKSAK